jgi:DNA invertase Pin-like site-specific DNA recombinase
VSFIANLMDAGVDFSACDLPEAGRLLLHIISAVAENEARAISDRTGVALAAGKARGTILGAQNPNSRNLTEDAAAKGSSDGNESG